MSYQCVYLTELADLTEGLYWARRITGEADAGRGKWVIVCIVGVPPFLDGYTIAYQPDTAESNPDEPWRMGYTKSDRYDMRIRPSEWEFGPRIAIPAQNARTEYAPKPAWAARP